MPGCGCCCRRDCEPGRTRHFHCRNCGKTSEGNFMQFSQIKLEESWRRERGKVKKNASCPSLKEDSWSFCLQKKEQIFSFQLEKKQQTEPLHPEYSWRLLACCLPLLVHLTSPAVRLPINTVSTFYTVSKFTELKNRMVCHVTTFIQLSWIKVWLFGFSFVLALV